MPRVSPPLLAVRVWWLRWLHEADLPLLLPPSP